MKFPSVEFDGSLYRIHRADRGPAWFGGTGDFRFDPPDTHRGRYGVCYTATEPLGAFVEVFGRTRRIPRREIVERRLATMTVNRLRLADLTDRRVLGDHAVDAAVSTGDDYGLPQSLSAHLSDEGFDGILYRLRHDPAMELEGVALFAEPGETPGRFAAVKTDLVPNELVAVAADVFGLVVLNTGALY